MLRPAINLPAARPIAVVGMACRFPGAEDLAAFRRLLARNAVTEGDLPAGGDCGFVRAVAGAYEAGLTVSFAGLFAGETRRRVSLPGYPFQRRRRRIEKRYGNG